VCVCVCVCEREREREREREIANINLQAMTSSPKGRKFSYHNSSKQNTTA
jgi:hypothetical protein